MGTFGSRLRQLRDERQMSQKELGDVLGVTGAAISAYERGKNQPDFTMLQRIASFFRVSVDYLVGASKQRHDDADDQPTGGDDDELYVVFRGKRQELPPEYRRVLIDMIEAAHRKAEKDGQNPEDG